MRPDNLRLCAFQTNLERSLGENVEFFLVSLPSVRLLSFARYLDPGGSTSRTSEYFRDSVEMNCRADWPTYHSSSFSCTGNGTQSGSLYMNVAMHTILFPVERLS